MGMTKSDYTAFTASELAAHNEEIRFRARGETGTKMRAIELAISAGAPASEVIELARAIETYLREPTNG